MSTDSGSTAFRAVSPQLDTVYTSIERFVRDFGHIDPAWPRSRVRELAESSRALLDGEHAIWLALTTAFQGGMRELGPLVNAAGARRTAVLSALIPLSVRLQRRAAKPAAEAAEQSPQAEACADDRHDVFIEVLQEFLTAQDELATFDKFLVLVREHKPALIDHLLRADTQPVHTLGRRLWYGQSSEGLADLVVAELVADSAVVLPRLMADPIVGSRFQALAGLLAHAAPPTRASIEAELARAGVVDVQPADTEILLRCLLVGHPDAGIQRAAAAGARPESIWRILAYPRLSVPTLVATGQHIFATQGENERRLFFDLARSHVASALMEQRDQCLRTKELIEAFFAQAFFVEREYFERLEQLLRLFRQVAPTEDGAIPMLEAALQRLATTRSQSGNPRAQLPKGVALLPPPVQRHLARAEEHYVEHFVLHPDYRIAGETSVHIGLENLNRLLIYRGINDLLFGQLLKKKEFFTRASTILLALNHPKCTREFALEYLDWIKPLELQALAANRSANRQVVEIVRNRLRTRGIPVRGMTGHEDKGRSPGQSGEGSRTIARGR